MRYQIERSSEREFLAFEPYLDGDDEIEMPPILCNDLACWDVIDSQANHPRHRPIIEHVTRPVANRICETLNEKVV